MNPSSLLIKVMIEHCMNVNVSSFSKGYISLFFLSLSFIFDLNNMLLSFYNKKRIQLLEI